jgi:hypothetical protein
MPVCPKHVELILKINKYCYFLHLVGLDFITLRTLKMHGQTQIKIKSQLHLKIPPVPRSKHTPSRLSWGVCMYGFYNVWCFANMYTCIYCVFVLFVLCFVLFVLCFVLFVLCFCIVFTVFLYCFVYVYLFLFVLSVLV